MDLRKWPIFAVSVLDNAVYKKIKFAIVLGKEGKDAFYVTDDDEVWAIGENCNNGFGGMSLETHPRQGTKIIVLGYKRICDLCSSLCHSVALTETGEVYTWGKDADICNLGRGIETITAAEPGRVLRGLENVKIKQIACGRGHTLALSEEGEVFAWGYNHYGQIGNDNNYTNVEIPFRVLNANSSPYIQIGCQDLSSFALNADGEVFAWGYNYANYAFQPTPRKVELSAVKIKNIACGSRHTLALSEDGVLYSWGGNSNWELGTPLRQERPAPVGANMGRIKCIAAARYSTISAAMTENSQVYIWGQSRVQKFHEPRLTTCNSLHEVFAHFSPVAVSYKPIVHVPDQTIRLLKTFEQGFDDQTTSDLTIQIGNYKIYVHSGILKMKCLYFQKMLSEMWYKDETNKVLRITTKSYTVFKAFLKYLYSGVVDLPVEQVFDLVDLGNEYIEKDLKEVCEQMIKKHVTVENVQTFYVTALAIKNEEISNFCKSYATNHMVPLTI